MHEVARAAAGQAGRSSTPLGANTPGAGHVLAVVGMDESSIVNGALRKWLWNGVAVVVSVHVAGSGGDVRLTSFCSRHVYGVPAWLTCVVCAAIGAAQPVDALPAAVEVVEAVVLLVDDDDALDRAQPLAVMVVVAVTGAVRGGDRGRGERESGGGAQGERAPMREPHADPSPGSVPV